MPRVVSEAISQVEYRPQSRELDIWFHSSGGPYTYYGVPPDVYEALLRADSKGEFFNEYIRDQYSESR